MQPIDRSTDLKLSAISNELNIQLATSHIRRLRKEIEQHTTWSNYYYFKSSMVPYACENQIIKRLEYEMMYWQAVIEDPDLAFLSDAGREQWIEIHRPKDWD